MKIVHVLTSAATSWGGPPRAVRNLTAGLNKLGVENTVVTLEDRAVGSVQFPGETKVRTCGKVLFGYSQGGNSILAKMAIPASTAFLRVLVAEIGSADLVHLHELWSVPHFFGGLISKIANRPFIVSPHGELTPWALGRRHRLKRLAWHAYEKQLLLGVSGIHALSLAEEEYCLQLDSRLPVKVIPNGVDIENIDQLLGLLKDVDKDGSASPFALYVGRLAAGKGLDILLEAMGEVNKQAIELSLILVGPDEFGLWPKMHSKAIALGIGERVKYLGVINEPYKYAVFASAALFILPSESEGMSLSLLEALACGTPLVVTPECNITQNELGLAGVVVEPNAKSISAAVIKMLQDPAMFRARRKAARQLASERYSNDIIANRMMQFYADAISRSQP